MTQGRRESAEESNLLKLERSQNMATPGARVGWQWQGHVLAAWDALGRAGEAVLAA